MDRQSRRVNLWIVALIAALGLCLLAAIAAVALFHRVTGAAHPAPAAGRSEPDSYALNGIANYVLPDGYRQDLGLNVAGVAMVFINHNSGHAHIYLMNMPRAYPRFSEPDMVRDLRRQTEHRSGFLTETARTRVVGKRVVSIRGQAVTLQVSEGANSAGQPYREFVGVFEGSHGRVLLMIAGQADLLEDTTVESFVASIE